MDAQWHGPSHVEGPLQRDHVHRCPSFRAHVCHGRQGLLGEVLEHRYRQVQDDLSRPQVSPISMLDIGHFVDACEPTRNSVRDCYFVGGAGEVMASNDGAIHVWDPEPGQRLLHFESDNSPFTAFRPLFSPFTLAAATQESLWCVRMSWYLICCGCTHPVA